MSKNKIIVTSAVVGVIICIIGALYFFTDTFKSNKEVFNKYFVKSQEQLVDENFLKTYLNASVRETSESNSTSTNIDLYSQEQEELSKLVSLQISSLKNKNLEQDYKRMKISDSNQDIAAIQYVRDGNIHALGIDNVLTKYVSADKNNFNDIARKLEIDNSENVTPFINEINYNQLLSVDNEISNNLKQKYLTIISNNIEKEKYTKIKNDDKTESLILTLSSKDVDSILEKILEEAKDDQVLLNIIKEKANVLGYNTEIIDIQNKINEMLSELANLEPQEGEFKISLTKKDKNIIKYILQISGSELKGQTIIELDCSQKNKLILQINSESQNFKLVMSYSFNDSSINFEFIVYKIENGQENQICNFKSEILNYNLDKTITNCKLDLELNKEKYQINMQKEIVFKQDVQIEKLTTENSVRVDLMTDEQFNQLIIAIVQRINSLYNEQMNNLKNFTNDVI